MEKMLTPWTRWGLILGGYIIMVAVDVQTNRMVGFLFHPRAITGVLDGVEHDTDA
jgi:hypothetical protein